MASRKLHPDAVLPLVCMIAGAVLGALFSGGETQWPVYVLTIVGAIVGIVVNAVTRKG